MGRNKNKNKNKSSKKDRRRGKRKFNDLEWQSELFKLRAQLRPFGLMIREITGDGNCLFRAISDQLIGTESSHFAYRSMAVQFMIQSREDFEPFVEDDKPFDSYVQDMLSNAIWGGNMELQALSLALEVNIRIHILGSPIWDIINFSPEQRSIHLSYHDGDHYNSVRLASDDTYDPAKSIPFNLEISQSVESFDQSAWDDSVHYAKLLMSEDDVKVIEGFLRTRYENPPDIDQLNSDVGSLIDDFYNWDRTPYQPEEKKVEMKPNVIDKKLRPRVLPKNNAKCWCGSNKKYNKCCKSSDMFRDTEPEQVITKLDSLAI